METKQSEPKEMGDKAVAQGSVLGDLIFIIFQNDFPESSEDGARILYADDDTDHLKIKIQENSDRSTTWYRDNGMVCSGDKTKLLILGTKEMRQSMIKTQLQKQIDRNNCLQ